ncbi:Pls/PosA family non-ribosomal peptide synthetase [Oryzihumus sp.]|uniref:Pls/PosA family non-ribosomal peptide synthetase n=1 Tax=Oryzihumus sp. TaxID=1968903 RepID=UPI0039C8E3F6
MDLRNPGEDASVHDDGLSRAPLAAPPRTLVEVLLATRDRHRGAPAIDDGHVTLTYWQLLEAVDVQAARLAAEGIGAGDKVGVRVPSGTVDLYVAILAVLTVGAAYVPVDADDPDERARLVFAEAGVAAVVGAGGEVVRRTPSRTARRLPTPQDDAWVIFTSGSTGTPKGVAVTHRSAAAFVDAEARLFLPEAPLGPGDRVLAGLSVAFDASCEEMWLAWRHGACLVPAPRALVRSGMDLGPWLVAQGITVISTVPTLASLWQPEELRGIRLLIFGGEACPPELAARLVEPAREVWNTYGPTEATVVACAAQLSGQGPVRIGLPLDGWDLAVVDTDGHRVPVGGTGELVIGGVGLARYLDADKDREKFAPSPTLGWERAYRSGDLVRHDPEGLVFVGRADDQVKVGGRRIELGEVDAALQGLPGVTAAAAAVRTTPAGTPVLVGYLTVAPGTDFDQPAARERLSASLPAALVPLLAVVPTLPTRISGKVDRHALPWPLEPDVAPGAAGLTGTAAWLAEQWTAVLGVGVRGPEDDFFADGGGSLSAAQLVSALRARYPEVTVADVYENPRLGALAQVLEEFSPPVSATSRTVAPVPRSAGVVQALASVVTATVVGLRWLIVLALVDNLLAGSGATWATPVSWWWVLAGWVLLFTPPGRIGLAVLAARLLLRGLRPGSYPRGGPVHLRLWCAEAAVAASGAENLSCAPWTSLYARALGARVGRDVDLHALPPVTGLLTLGQGCAVEPEVDLSGHWLDGDVLHVGRVKVGAGATVGARSTLGPGSRVGQGAEVGAGSAVLGNVPPAERWAGSPAAFAGIAHADSPGRRAPRSRVWPVVYGLTALALATLPLVAVACGALVLGRAVRGTATVGGAAVAALVWVPVATLVMVAVLALLVLVGVRLLALGLSEGHHPVHSRVGWQVWATERLMDESRSLLFPLYASLATPGWLRALGARIGRDVEASTVLMLPSMTTIADGAFLADDTMIGSYELVGGWLRVERAKVGKRAFLGNSGMTGPGLRVPKRGLVAVLSTTPARAKAGTSWLGSPPVRLRRPPASGDETRTFHPPRRLKVARGAVEVLRIVPVMCTVALGVLVLLVLQEVVVRSGWAVAGLVSGLLVLAAGALAAGVSSLAKWALVGRFAVGEHPLWSSFVWRNELADTFVEVLAAPWFARAAAGTPGLVLWLRSLGARIGHGTWCETYWLPEADLVSIGAAATVNRGCVLQTHLFHDRIMSMDRVTLEEGATLGPHGVVLPAATVGAATTVGPASLVLRGEALPAHTRWRGNPVEPWPERQADAGAAARQKAGSR